MFKEKHTPGGGGGGGGGGQSVFFFTNTFSSLVSYVSFVLSLFVPHLYIFPQIDGKKFISVKLRDWMSNSVDPDETAHYEPSHLDLRWLQKPIILNRLWQ